MADDISDKHWDKIQETVRNILAKQGEAVETTSILRALKANWLLLGDEAKLDDYLKVNVREEKVAALAVAQDEAKRIQAEIDAIDNPKPEVIPR